jgi:hypothetical protein
MRFQIHSGSWHGLSLTDIARDAGIPVNRIASSDVYDALYKRWKAEGFHADPGWREAKSQVRDLVTASLERALPGCKGPFLSAGVGLCYIEELMMEQGYTVDLQECQDHSFARIREVLGDRMPKTFVSDSLAAVPGQGDYAGVIAMGLTYVFDDSAYLDFLRQSRRLIRKGGVLLHACHDIKFWPEYQAKRVVKKLIGRHEIPWGYLRSPDNHLKMARLAGGFEPVEVQTWGLDHQPNRVRRVFGMPIPGQPAHGVTVVLRAV